MKRGYWIAIGALASQIAGCSSAFDTCEASRTCPARGGSTNDGGSAGEGGSEAGESGGADGKEIRSGDGGSAGNPEGGAAVSGNETSAGDGGDAGSQSESCDSGYSMCGSGCAFTDDDSENCGGCNLKCPTGSLCKSGMCEVRIGYPNRFTGGAPFHGTADLINLVPIALARRSTLIALGYLNESATAGAVATFGLYNDSGSKSPGALVVSAPGVTLQGAVHEIAVTNVVLNPGTYYFAILPRDDNEPAIPLSISDSPTTDLWVSGDGSYQSGLPPNFGAFGAEAFGSHVMNVYLVVKQAGAAD
jgi:hypothetical protein